MITSYGMLKVKASDPNRTFGAEFGGPHFFLFDGPTLGHVFGHVGRGSHGLDIDNQNILNCLQKSGVNQA